MRTALRWIGRLVFVRTSPRTRVPTSGGNCLSLVGGGFAAFVYEYVFAREEEPAEAA